MPVLKKDAKCRCCGGTMKAGQQFNWHEAKRAVISRKYGMTYGTRYEIQHYTFAECEAVKQSLAPKKGTIT